MRVQDFMTDQFDGDFEDDIRNARSAQEAAAIIAKRRSTQRTPDDLKVTGLTEQTIDEIDALFPERAPDPSDSEREIWMKAGERRLVRFLIDQYQLAHTLTENE